MSDTVETELKIPVADLAPVRERLEATDATCVHRRARETNLLLDADDGLLARDRCALRLRRWGDTAWITFKGPPSWRDGVKRREETESEVADPDAVERILRRLGFGRVARYDKDRERWRLGGVMVELDHTPIGDFVELEGPEAELAGTARSLGLDPDDAVEGSYLALWRAHREAHPELDLPLDMVLP